MTIIQWFIFFLLLQLIHGFGTWKLYKIAGRKPWEAFVPVYNAIVLMKIINRPWWWTILLFIPIVNLIMFPVVWVETARSFGKHTKADTWLSILTIGFYLYYINYTQEVNHISDRSLKPRTEVGEWVSSILFAIVAATIVHTYFIQPFTIPTSSLEKTLLVGDFLFVSKFHYGARTPQTTVSFPMVHDTIPVLGIKSYTNWPQLPYFRLPGFEDIERNDIVVFNWPVDTVRKFFDRSGKHYQKPIDKKSNYVKRAVGLPGDSLKIVDGKVYINQKPLMLPERAKPQYSYIVQGKGQGFDLRNLAQRYNITDPVGWYNQAKRQYRFVSLSEETIQKFKNHPNVASITKIIDPVEQTDARIFPSARMNWNHDQMGSIYIPEKGKTVAINPKSLPFYKRIIEVYEGIEMGNPHKITVNGKQVLLDNEPLTQYTFKQNYYFMMGDNRHNSEDSRYWGYVPENHVVGKPIFIWMSWDTHANGFFNKIRWERLFTTVGGEGKPVSYLYYFLIGLVIVIGFNFFRKRKKKA
ncbi:signal peptidase I [Mesonia aestuariivivens]|uniref:Signal peptidase I n=1 Tax=Mesonia aestuariivivens TaxID=2796128 RepID=A0ABS6VZZ3_9FLAO|nr:signal peptidase I [Mesonia aestuariivivens]MBW2961147.1 signal peptidase I [Mesonia aestuariivivens]